MGTQFWHVYEWNRDEKSSWKKVSGKKVTTAVFSSKKKHAESVDLAIQYALLFQEKTIDIEKIDSSRKKEVE